VIGVAHCQSPPPSLLLFQHNFAPAVSGTIESTLLRSRPVPSLTATGMDPLPWPSFLVSGTGPLSWPFFQVPYSLSHAPAAPGTGSWCTASRACPCRSAMAEGRGRRTNGGSCRRGVHLVSAVARGHTVLQSSRPWYVPPRTAGSDAPSTCRRPRCWGCRSPHSRRCCGGREA
jgi:hypothetical protein